MEKVYLLLRNNEQTGPYTIEEMLQQQLLPTDLIWIEGKSATWSYPSEIDWSRTLAPVKPIKPSAPCTEPTRSTNTGRAAASPTFGQNAPVSTPLYLKRKSPEAELEARALELRNNVQAAAAEQRYRPSVPITPQRQHRIHETEENPILLEVHTLGKKSVTLPQLIGAAVLTALLAAGWYNRESLTVIRPSQNILSTAATPVVFQVMLPPAPMVLQMPAADTTNKVVTPSVTATPVVTSRTQPRQKIEPQRLQKISTEPVAATTVATLKTAEPEPKETVKTTIATTATTEKKEVVALAKNDEPVTATVSEAGTKKRTLGQAIKSIFKKKKKEETEIPATAQ